MVMGSVMTRLWTGYEAIAIHSERSERYVCTSYILRVAWASRYMTVLISVLMSVLMCVLVMVVVSGLRCTRRVSEWPGDGREYTV